MANQEELNQELLAATLLYGRVDPARVEAALANGADAACRDENGRTPPLISAAVNEAPRALLQRLVAAGCPVNAQDNNGGTALMWPAIYNDCEGVRVLLAAGADPSLRTNGGDTAEDLAKKRGRTAIVALLQGAEGATATAEVVARQEGHTDIVAPLQAALPPPPPSSQEELNEELQAAIKQRPRVDPARVEAALANGADAACQDRNGATPLINAAANNAPAAVLQRLLSAGSPVNAQNNDGFTALMYSSGRNNVDGVGVLLAAGADTSLRNNQGNTAEDVARRWDATKTVALLQAAEGAEDVARG